MSEIRYKRGYKYQLVKRTRIQLPWKPARVARILGPEDVPMATLTTEGWLVIESLYAWDGPSGPAIDTNDFMGASLVHDVLYQMIRLGQLPGSWRKFADEILYRACLGAGMWKIRAAWCYWGVREGAGWAARPSAEPKERTAPLVLAEVL